MGRGEGEVFFALQSSVRSDIREIWAEVQQLSERTEVRGAASAERTDKKLEQITARMDAKFEKHSEQIAVSNATLQAQAVAKWTRVSLGAVSFYAGSRV